MKKLFSMFLIATLLGMVFTACGNDKNEPEDPKTKNLTTVHESATDQYFVFDIDMNNDKGTIYMYNIQFAPRAPKMNLRVNVPVSLNQSGSAYIMMGTNLICEMDMPSAGGWVPMPDEQYQLKNLTCTVNPKAKKYAISFDAHGGSGELE